MLGTKFASGHLIGVQAFGSAEAPRKENACMPQLDIATFSTQYFWIVISFGFFFLSLVQWALPSMTRVLAYRAHATAQAETPAETSEHADEQGHHKEVFDAMHTALQSTQQTVHLPNEMETAAYAAATHTFQQALMAECTLLQVEGVAHSPFAHETPALTRGATIAVLQALQDRLASA